MILLAAIIFIFSYLLGSINFTVILFRLMKLDDPRERFSGNPGVTNVYRISGPFWAALILILDIGRAGAVSIVSMGYLSEDAAAFAGFFLVLGNRYPCFHGFKGGKGVANYMGFVIFLIPLWGLLATLLWPLIYKLTKVTFIASFAMIALMGIGASLFFQFNAYAVAATSATLILIFAGHKKNVREFLLS